MIQGLLGFWRYPPSSGTSFYIAVVASIAITIGFFRRRAWARVAAVLVGALGIVNELPNASGGAVQPLLIIAFDVLVIYWLNRKQLQGHFKGASVSTQPGDDA